MSRENTASRHSPVASLASLEYLQNNRRASQTDPALHPAHSPSYRHAQVPSSSSSNDHTLSDPRPASPYVFGNATPHVSDHLRKLLHSPSNDHRPQHQYSHDSSRPNTGPGMSTKESNLMNVDNERHPFIARRSIRDPPSFDFNMRRHSIAVGQNSVTLPQLSSTLHGAKRKMSADRGVFPPVGEDTDPQLLGPGMPSVMDIDVDAPAPKRRGSTIDTQRIAQMSLNDRRNSVDSRSWLNDRRESAPSLFPTVPGINSFNHTSSDAQHGRVPPSLATFSWSPNPSESSGLANGSSHGSRHLDSIPPMNLVPPSNYTPDRRMSVPDILNHASSSRSVRDRSRPPSRQGTDTHSGPPSGQDEDPGKFGKDSTTPYSRSPELRVSHKLAERKRRKEMKDLFDELRQQLPADRGMKASKWEILSKAVDFIAQLKESHQELVTEVEHLRGQGRGPRSEGPPVYPPGGVTQHSHPGYGGGGGQMIQSFPPHMHPSHPSQNRDGHPGSESSQNQLSASANSSSQNTNGQRADSASS